MKPRQSVQAILPMRGRSHSSVQAHDAASLADGQPNARATLHFRVEDGAGSIEARPRVQHHDDMLIISRPRLDLVEIVLVRVVRIVRLLFGPIAHESGRTVPALS